MKISAKLADLSKNNDGRDYDEAQFFDAAKQYMAESGLVFEDVTNHSARSLEDIVGKLECLELRDSALHAKVELLDTPKGLAIQQIVCENPESISFVPYVSYRKLGDKILDLRIEEIMALPTSKIEKL